MVTLYFTRNEFPHVISGRRASETHNFAIGGCGGGNYSVQVDAKSMECLGGGEGALRSPPASRKSLCSVSGTGSVSPRNSMRAMTDVRKRMSLALNAKI